VRQFCFVVAGTGRIKVPFDCEPKELFMLKSKKAPKPDQAKTKEPKQVAPADVKPVSEAAEKSGVEAPAAYVAGDPIPVKTTDELAAEVAVGLQDDGPKNGETVPPVPHEGVTEVQDAAIDAHAAEPEVEHDGEPVPTVTFEELVARPDPVAAEPDGSLESAGYVRAPYR
jgi:hypothetical protein